VTLDGSLLRDCVNEKCDLRRFTLEKFAYIGDNIGGTQLVKRSSLGTVECTRPEACPTIFVGAWHCPHVGA